LQFRRPTRSPLRFRRCGVVGRSDPHHCMALQSINRSRASVAVDDIEVEAPVSSIMEFVTFRPRRD